MGTGGLEYPEGLGYKKRTNWNCMNRYLDSDDISGRRKIVMKKVNMVLVGFGFEDAFAEIYKHHLNIGSIGLFDMNSGILKKRVKTR